VLVHVAANDEYFSPTSAAALEEQLHGLGKEAEFHVYDGADHAFFNDTRPEVHDVDASATAWARTIDFFHTRLG
jgi:carboxymethylenebutenolidase